MGIPSFSPWTGRRLLGLAAGMLMGWAVPAFSLSPMEAFYGLVAGESATGHEDGPFYRATFDQPCGVAFRPADSKLFVADQGDHCIRVIDLADRNKVSTLAGTGKAGYADGPLSTAAFNQPRCLAFLSDSRLAVADAANHRIRLVDLNQKRATTLAGNGQPGFGEGEGQKCATGAIWSMAFLPSEDALYFSEPESNALQKLDLKTGRVSTLLRNRPEVPNPAALGVWKGRLYVADLRLPLVYRVSRTEGGAVTLQLEGSGSHVRALAGCGKGLYALQADPAVPLKRLLPADGAVHFLSPWGETLPGPERNLPFFDGLAEAGGIQFVPDPRVEGKFFIPNPRHQSVFYFKDYFPEEVLNSDWNGPRSTGLTDFDYPKAKPAGTYRILILGDSHVFHTDDRDVQKRGWSHYNLMDALAKKLEFTLNALASLDDVPFHYEVLAQARIASDRSLLVWPCHEAPAVVRDYGIDLVLYFFSPNMVSPFTYQSYFQYPLTPEGIPADQIDPEFLLKGAQDKIPPGLPGDFYRLCRRKNLAKLSGKNVVFEDFNQLVLDPEVEKDLVGLFERPLGLLNRRIGETSSAKGRPALVVGLLPLGSIYSTRAQKTFWGDLQKSLGVPLLDLSDDFTALRASFYPLSSGHDLDHLTNDGYGFTALVLSHELIRRKIIPFSNKE